ncbi:MAG: hypothetical protein M3Q27_18030, partial [Actinomycetota bacterium]|nr:hypothetical protein [Actinomycetota bacterium]
DAAVLASLCGSDAETGSGAPQGAERVGTGCVGAGCSVSRWTRRMSRRWRRWTRRGYGVRAG